MSDIINVNTSQPEPQMALGGGGIPILADPCCPECGCLICGCGSS